MSNKYFITVLLQLLLIPGLSQSFSLNDSTIVFKNEAGKVLNKDELKIITTGVFSTKTDILPNGKKIITIIPNSSKNLTDHEQELINFKNSLRGHLLPDFELYDLNGNKLSREELKDKVLVFNFWFIGCKPCVMEIPLLNELTKEYKDQDVVFIAPALDGVDAIKSFLQKRNFDYRITPDAKEYAKNLGIVNFPTHLIVDANGIIQEIFIGYSINIKTEISHAIKKALWQTKLAATK